MLNIHEPLNPAAFFQCLSDDTRLKSLLLLQLKNELCVCELSDALQQSQPKMSRHLAELRACRLVKSERRGKWVYYRINSQVPSWALSVLSQSARAHADAYLSECLTRLQNATAACC